MTKQKFTNRDTDVLTIFWNAEKPLTASEVARIQPEISINTIHSVLKNLLKNGNIVVDEVVYSGTVLSRSYRPTITREEFILNQFENIKFENLLAHFVDDEKDAAQLDTYEEIIQKRKEQLDGNA